MKVKYRLSIALLLLIISGIQAQKDSTRIKLDEFSLSILKVKDFSKGIIFNKISDSLINRDINSLTDILRFNSFIYFKENGLGMVSSPAFRGTNASHTAVVWNGISINSYFNGQTDFNAISANSYDDITIRRGGGSVLYGSGAIGGTVNLNNKITFKNAFKANLILKYGSFSTKHLSYDLMKSDKKSYINISLGFNDSDNNYKYLNSDLTNDNGGFRNFNLDLNYGYKINAKNRLKLYTTSFFAKRNFSRDLIKSSNDLQNDINLKTLIEWEHFMSSNEVLTSRMSYIYDEFTYYFDKNNLGAFSTGKTNRKIVQIDYNNYITKKIKLNSIISFETVNAISPNFSNPKKRNIFSGVFSIDHLLSDKLSYGVKIRKDIQNPYNSPFLISAGIEQKFNKKYSLSFNASKNFRTPTFNDLYWANSGNPDLKPEESHQFEIVNSFNFKNLKFQINGFYIKSSDLIAWASSIDNTNVWKPYNIDSSRNLGLELSTNYKAFFEKHLIKLNINYSYTEAKNLKTKKLLDHTPVTRANILIDYNYSGFNLYYQLLFNDKITSFTDTIPEFYVSNIGFNYKIKTSKHDFILGFKVNNVFNLYYQNTLNRPMPGANFQINARIKFKN